jgi:hypothetical protein
MIPDDDTPDSIDVFQFECAVQIEACFSDNDVFKSVVFGDQEGEIPNDDTLDSIDVFKSECAVHIEACFSDVDPEIGG